MAELKTTILMRQGTTAEWANSGVILKSGEMGLEYCVDGAVKIKAGDGEHAWDNLSYIGSDVKAANVFQVELGEGQIDDIAAIEEKVAEEQATKQNGDIAIVKATIADGKYSYTSYVYEEALDTENENSSHGWSAMDGNYSASNVFLKNKIELAGSFTAVGNYNKGKTINAGTSLESLLSGMLQQELYPTSNDKPNAEITASGGSGEVGTQYNLPTATLKITDVGSFEYGDKTTGITFAIGDVKLVQGSDPTSTTANSKTNNAVMVKDSTITLTAVDTNAVNGKLYYNDTSKSFVFTGTAKYSDSKIPVTNLGNAYPDAQIKSATITLNQANNNTHKTVTFSGYRKAFAGGTTAPLSSEIIRAATATKNSKATMDSQGEALEFTAAQGATKIFFAYPATWTGTPYFEMFGLAWAENGDFVAESNVQVADARGTVEGTLQNPVDYKVYAWTPAGPLTAESTKFRVWFK